MSLKLAYSLGQQNLPVLCKVWIPEYREGFSFHNETKEDIERVLQTAKIDKYAIIDEGDYFSLFFQSKYHKTLFLLQYEGDQEEDISFEINCSSVDIATTMSTVNIFIRELDMADCAMATIISPEKILVSFGSRAPYIYLVEEIKALQNNPASSKVHTQDALKL